MSNFRVSVFLFSLMLGAVCLRSAVVVVELDNGDILSGEPVAEQADAVVLRVDYLGKVNLPKERIDNLEEFRRALASSLEPVAVADNAVGELPAVVEANGGEASDVMEDAAPNGPLGRAQDLLVGYIPFAKWEKQLQFGLDSKSGRRDQTNFNYRFDMQRKDERDQHRVKAAYYYGEALDVTTSNRFSSSYRWRRTLSPGFFYESNTGYSFDRIKLIDSNFEHKFGLGSRIMDSETSVLSAGLGASGRWREFAVKDDEVLYLVDLFQDWDYHITERVRLKQDMRVAMPLEEEENYEINFSAALTSDITSSISVSLRYELDYDNSLNENLRENRRFISSLGYEF